MKKSKHLKFILIIIDAISVGLGWVSSYFLREFLSPVFGKAINPFSVYLNVLPLVVFLWIVGNSSFGLYQRIRSKTGLEELMKILKADFMGLLILMAMGFLFKEYDFGRSVVLLTGITNLVFLFLGRWIFRRYERHLIKRGKGVVKAVIIGAGTTGIRALQKITDNPDIGYEVVGFLDDDPLKQGQKIGKVPVLGPLSSLREVVQKYNVDEVIFAIPSLPHKRILSLIMEVDNLDLTIRVVSDLFGVLAHETNIDLIEDFPIFDLKGGQAGPFYDIAKRIFDLTFATLGLILSLPLWLIIAIAIKLDSPGPVIFKQERVGKDGKIFTMYKFRTMYKDTPKFSYAPSDKSDPRITSIGKFLRSTSLDELPQLINVIKGEMSLVGPRPEMPFIVEQYEEWQRKRLEVLPGITGLWQILGRKDIPLHENLEYDFYYIKNRSFWLDLTIILKTVPVLIKRKGAY